MLYRIILFLSITTSFFCSLHAQNYRQQIAPVLSDTARISLLTSTPWDEVIYALFGHTALRIHDPELGIDDVYNYGIFDFYGPNFITRFVKGETDYVVDKAPYKYYVKEYSERGVGIYEQVFNLTQEEKQAVYDALVINALPENRVYRYNYFYDNCSTRPRDIIEKNIQGTITYTPTNKKQTYRDLIHECVHVQPWSQFGIDLVIGSEADKIITHRQKDFLPLYLSNAYKDAFVTDTSGTDRKIISHESMLIQARAADTTRTPVLPNPLSVGCLILLVTIVISFIDWKNKWCVLVKLYDTILFFAAGVAGCIIFFLMFFSVHPCVNPNWNIVWLNPLQLVVSVLFFVKSLSKFIYCYHFINFAALLLFLLAWCLIPQQLEIAFIPFIISLCLRSGVNVTKQRKTSKRKLYSLPKIR